MFQSFLFAATFTHAPLSFQYDEKNWELVESAKPKAPDSVDAKMQGKTVVTLQRKNADEKYRARFSIVVDSLEKAKPQKGEAPYRAYTRYSQAFLKSQRFSVLDSRKMKVGLPAYEATDSTLFQRDFGLKFRQVIFVRGADAYLLTFTSRMKPFDDYGKEIEELLSTLRFSEPVAFKHNS